MGQFQGSLRLPGDSRPLPAQVQLRDGRLQYRETIYDGLDNAPRAFIGLFQGDNLGKALVRL